MLKIRKRILFFCLALFCLISSSCEFFPDLGICENTPEKEIVSPNGKLKAVIFDRGCGATVGFITGISIYPIDKKIHNNDSGNVLFAENVYREFTYKNGETHYGKTNFDAEWLSDDELLVSYTESKNISRARSYKNVKIKYELIPK